MPRPILAHIDLSALEHNLQVARRATTARVMAVIKANGYGHGLMRTASALNAADGFALLDVHDAVRLREMGFRQTMLMLEGCFSADDMELVAAHELASVVHTPQQLDMLDAYPRREGLQVWLKVNSGMNRLGFVPEDVPAAMNRLKSHRAVKDVVLMTHFASAGEAAGMGDQLERFNEAVAPYKAARSLANSAALLRFPQSHGDWVRPGIMLYGSSPFDDAGAEQLGLKAVMTLRSEIIAIQELRAGECVGYGGTFCADRPMRIGVVACGYGDGYPRHAGTGTPVLVEGQRTHTLGRVSMDMLCADLSDLPDAKVGSRVTLWGEGLSIDEIARAAGTISYELLCIVTRRVPIVEI